MKRALIFGGGVYGEEFPVISDDDYIIAAVGLSTVDFIWRMWYKTSNDERGETHVCN